MAVLTPGSALDDERLAALFTAVYAGYWHPIEIDAGALRRMISTYDLDLDASVVAWDGDTPVGLAMLAVRGPEAWIAGMGVTPERRGAGLGEALTRRLLDAARERGVTRVRLEVLEQNAPAIAIYRRLGFEDFAEVAVWRLESAPGGLDAHDEDVTAALAALATVEADAPWQRNPRTVANMRALGSALTAVGAGAGLAVFASAEGHASLLELAATTEDEAAALLQAPFARGASTLLWLNGPVAGVAADALRRAGAAQLAIQHELELSLS
jgi:ribosomal protein S18 acetylase RimI-like enzyme